MYEWYLIIIIVFLNADNKIEEQHIKHNPSEPKVNYVECNKLKLTKEFVNEYIDAQKRTKNLILIKSDCVGIKPKGFKSV